MKCLITTPSDSTFEWNITPQEMLAFVDSCKKSPTDVLYTVIVWGSVIISAFSSLKGVIFTATSMYSWLFILYLIVFQHVLYGDDSSGNGLFQSIVSIFALFQSFEFFF